MDELGFLDVPEEPLDVAGRVAHDASGFRRGIVHQPARDLATLRVDAGHHFAAFEAAAHVDHADRKQALAVAHQRRHGACVERQLTGDYSRGAAGFWIENGQIAYPVSGVTIAGNLQDMFRELTPADDLEFRYGTNAPTIRVEGMTVAGS